MKKLVSLILGALILFSSLALATSVGSGSGETGDDYQAGYNAGYSDGYSDGSDNVYKPREPNVVFEKQDEIPEIEAGGTIKIEAKFKNDSSYSASSLKITPSFDNVPLVYERPIVYEATKNLKARGTNSTVFTFKVKEDAKVGVYGINFKIEYKNNADENFTKDATLYFRVNKEKVQSMITISNIVTEPESVVAGERFTLKFNINNIGDVTATNTKINLTSLSTDTFMPVDGNDFAYIGDLNAKTSTTKSFNLIASENIAKGSNTVGMDITYLNSNNEEVKESKTIYVLGVISNKEKVDEDAKEAKPKIIIESYNTSPNSIVAGSTMYFSFKFKNTSKDKTISNMKITISSEEGAFMITNGSNTFYIESLGPQASDTKMIELNVKQDLTSKSYPIKLDFDYEDASANAYQSSEIINIPVVEYSNLVINSVYVSEGMVDQQTNISFDYINMGKAAVSNLTASVEGDYTSVQSINYIGNLEAGSSDYFDIEVTPTKVGENVGTLVLTFEDSSGKKIDVRKEFTGYAMEMPTYDDPGMEDPGIMEPSEPMETEEPFNVWLGVGVGFGSFLIAFFVAKIITTKIIRKKLEDEI